MGDASSVPLLCISPFSLSFMLIFNGNIPSCRAMTTHGDMRCIGSIDQRIRATRLSMTVHLQCPCTRCKHRAFACILIMTSKSNIHCRQCIHFRVSRANTLSFTMHIAICTISASEQCICTVIRIPDATEGSIHSQCTYTLKSDGNTQLQITNSTLDIRCIAA